MPVGCGWWTRRERHAGEVESVWIEECNPYTLAGIEEKKEGMERSSKDARRERNLVINRSG